VPGSRQAWYARERRRGHGLVKPAAPGRIAPRVSQTHDTAKAVIGVNADMRTSLRAGAFLTVLSCLGAVVAQEVNVTAHLSAAKLHESRGELARAEQELRAALEQAPAAERALVASAIAALLTRQGRNDEAAALTGAVPQGKGEDPIQRLIAVLDSGSTRNEAVKDAAAQLDSLGSLVVPHLLAALPKMGPFGISNTLDRLARFDDPRITAALANLIDSSDAVIAATVANDIPNMRRPVALPLAERIAQAKVEPRVQLGALRALLQYDGGAATTQQLAQRLAADPSGASQPALIEYLGHAEQPWVVDVLEALMKHASAEVRANATLEWIRDKKDLTEQQALAAIEALPPAHIVSVTLRIRALHPGWVKVGLLLLRTVRQTGPWGQSAQDLLGSWEWWRLPDESARELLALEFAERPQHEPSGAGMVFDVLEQLVARGWVLPADLDARVAKLAAWEILAKALPASAEDRALAVWETAADRRSFALRVREAEQPWHRLVARQLLLTTRSDQVDARLLQRDWTGAPPEAVAALAELAARWPGNPLDGQLPMSASGGQLQWHGALITAFQRNVILPPSVILPLVAAGNGGAWNALVARDPQAAVEQARGAKVLHSHQARDLTVLLSRHGRPSDVSLALRVLDLVESNGLGDYTQPMAFFAQHAAGHLDVIRLGCAPVPIGPGQGARASIAQKAARGARVQDLGELLALAPALNTNCCSALMNSLAPQIRAEHAAPLIAAIETLLAKPIGATEGNDMERPVNGYLLLSQLCGMVGNAGDAAALPVLQRILALESLDVRGQENHPKAWLVNAAANAALQVAGASREKLLLELLASPSVAVVRTALYTAGPRISAEFRDGMREAVLRVGESLDNDASLFGQLDTDDRLALAVAVLESERFAKFTRDLCREALRTVGLRKDVRYLPQLVKGASHPDEVVRVQAAQAIGNTFSREAGPHLIEILRDDRAEVRKAAQDALDQIANYLDARAKWEQRFK